MNARLAQLLEDEQEQYEREIESTFETPEQRKARLFARAKELRAKREAARKKEVARRDFERLRAGTDDLRKMDSDHLLLTATRERAAQLEEARRKAEEEAKEEERAAIEWERLRQEKIAREEREAAERAARNKEMIEALEGQVSLASELQQEAKAAEEEDAKRMLSQWKSEEQAEIEKEKAKLEAERRERERVRIENEITARQRAKEAGKEAEEDAARLKATLDREAAEEAAEAAAAERRRQEAIEHRRRLEEQMAVSCPRAAAAAHHIAHPQCAPLLLCAGGEGGAGRARRAVRSRAGARVAQAGDAVGGRGRGALAFDEGGRRVAPRGNGEGRGRRPPGTGGRQGARGAHEGGDCGRGGAACGEGAAAEGQEPGAPAGVVQPDEAARGDGREGEAGRLPRGPPDGPRRGGVPEAASRDEARGRAGAEPPAEDGGVVRLASLLRLLLHARAHAVSIVVHPFPPAFAVPLRQPLRATARPAQ